MKSYLHLYLFLFYTIHLSGQSTEFAEWRSEFLNAVRVESLSPNLMVRSLAIFSASAHDAINSLEKKYHPFLKLHKHNLLRWDLSAVIAGCGSKNQ